MKIMHIDHPHAVTAIIADSLRAKIGRWAARRYVEKRGCPLSLYYMACRLSAAEKIERGHK